MPPSDYEFFDHTADIGINARGATLAELFTHCAQGLTELIAEGSRLEPRTVRDIRLAAGNAEALLLAWLNELLFWFSSERFLPAQYDLDDVTETALSGRVRGEAFDPARHTSGTEVKGITRHQFFVKRAGSAWEAQVIFDV